MALPITYFDPPNTGELMQGDVLFRTPELERLIGEVHPYFQQGKYLCFMVITPSCDLVVRANGACKAPYITLAPVRSLDAVMQKELADNRVNIDAEVSVVTDSSHAALKMFLERLFNNNEPDYFYLDATNTLLSEDCCAFLKLAFSLKAPLHFGTCLAAKRLELKPEWQAKLGWLVAQLYNRVATDDLQPKDLQAKVKRALLDVTVSVPSAKVPALQAEVARLRAEKPELAITARQITSIAQAVGNRKPQVLDQVIAVAESTMPYGMGDQGLLVRLRKRLDSDAGLAALLKS